MWSSRRLRPAAAGVALLLAHGADAALDLSTLAVMPERGQSSEQTRRDRYECHNWAVDQTGALPGADRVGSEPRGERVDKVLSGASIGAALGGLIRGVQRRNPSHGVLAGAAVGAAVGAATSRPKDDDERSAADDDYLRALSACLEGRGYRVVVPGSEGERVAANEG